LYATSSVDRNKFKIQMPDMPDFQILLKLAFAVTITFGFCEMKIEDDLILF